MVEKIELWQNSELPSKDFVVRTKINELVDVINVLIEESNIHEKQIDKLQQKVLHEYKSIYDVIADADLSDKGDTK